MENFTFGAAETYLTALYRWGWACVRELARDLGRSPASVSAMLAKLEVLGWVQHSPYRSATLTEAGLREAARLEGGQARLERHLVGVLGHLPQAAHREAERISMALSDTLVRRLVGRA